VWGWILAGLIVGSTYSPNKNLLQNKIEQKNVKVTQRTPNSPPPLPVLISIVSMSVGFAAAFIPLKVDADYLTASKIGSAELLIKVSNNSATNSFLMSRAASVTADSGLKSESKAIVEKLAARFPRNLYGQQALFLSSESEIEKSQILERIEKIDPLVAVCYYPDYDQRFLSLLSKLPPPKQFELARGWGLVSELSASHRNSFSLGEIPPDDLRAKVITFCM